MAQENITIRWNRFPIKVRTFKHGTLLKISEENDEQKIPKAPGVYVFGKISYANKNKFVPLYVGCAEDIYERVVNGHFKYTSLHSKKIMGEFIKDKFQGEQVLLIGRIEAPRIRSNTHEIAEKALVRKLVEDKPKIKLINKKHTRTPSHYVEMKGNKITQDLFGEKLFLLS